jgi:putative alpha-1,2-mannosidase
MYKVNQSYKVNSKKAAANIKAPKMQLKKRSGLLLGGWLCAVGALFSLPLSAQNQDILSYARPEIGAAQSRWFFFTPGAAPQGMAKLAPSTNGHYGNASGWEAVGYDPRDPTIEGFVLFHEWQLGGAMLTATNGPLYNKTGDSSDPVKTGFRSHYRHSTEVARPGYYKVLLDDYHIKAELTATKHVGFLRFSFPGQVDKSKTAGNRIQLVMGSKWGESGEVQAADVRMVDAIHFEGYVRTYPKYVAIFDHEGAVQMYIYGELSQQPTAVGSFTEDKITSATKDYRAAASGKGCGLYFSYPDDQQVRGPVEVKVGLSYTSIKNAKNNLKVEAAGLNFDQANNQTRQIWTKALSRIKVQSTSKSLKEKFYTGLFHALLGRGVSSDVNGDYPKAYLPAVDSHDQMTQAVSVGHISPFVQKGKGAGANAGNLPFQMINSDAIWGAYWNLTQLWSLAYPNYLKDYVYTQLEMYKNRGWFSDGLVNSQYASGVGTNFVGLVIASAYQMGVFKELDPAKLDSIYQAVYKNVLGTRDANGDRPVGAGKSDLAAFVKKGYVPYIDGQNSTPAGSNFSASHTLEYSFGAFAAGQMAAAMGKKKDAALFNHYAGGWQHIFDSSLKLIRPKDTMGNFITHYDPYQPWRGFQEGNGMQYSFFVPWDPAGLVRAVGNDRFNDRLQEIFAAAEKLDFGGGKTMDAFSGVKAAYNQGNQPDMQMSWLFNFSGQPWRTQYWTRAIVQAFYGTDSIHGYGYGQDEDQGQLGGWLVMTSLGLFDVKGLTDRRPVIEIGSPAFDRAIIELGNGKQLVIEAQNNSADNVYVQSVTFNGQPLRQNWLYRDRLMQGGKLHFVMGTKPNKNWGVAELPQ